MITARNDNFQNEVFKVAFDLNSLVATNNELVDLPPNLNRHVQKVTRRERFDVRTCTDNR